MATEVKDKPQLDMFDRAVENPDLERQIDMFLENKQVTTAATQNVAAKYTVKAKDIRDTKKRIKEAVELMELRDGERVRVGRFVITGKARAGGGIAVPAWSKVLVGDIKALD